jgi:microsomal epoxide hydrolase
MPVHINHSCHILFPVLQDLIQYWLTSYDWRKWEAQLNSLPQYTQTIQGINLQYVHQPSANKDAVPLLLLHGWPGSFFEFYKLIPLLKASGRFHIVAPSLPGVLRICSPGTGLCKKTEATQSCSTGMGRGGGWEVAGAGGEGRACMHAYMYTAA